MKSNRMDPSGFAQQAYKVGQGMDPYDPRPLLDATELVPGLHIGSAPPRGALVADEDFDVLVLCAEEYQPALKWFPGLQSVIHCPMDDHIPTDREIDNAVSAAMDVADRYSRGQVTLVTCVAGRNRSGMVSALALHFITCLPLDEVVPYIQKKRRGVDGERALTNPWFVRLLEPMKVMCWPKGRKLPPKLK
jgi:protein-tyrosine phosphatase